MIYFLYKFYICYMPWMNISVLSGLSDGTKFMVLFMVLFMVYQVDSPYLYNLNLQSFKMEDFTSSANKVCTWAL